MDSKLHFIITGSFSICQSNDCNCHLITNGSEALTQIERERSARESHCLIEKKRREKMSRFIGELCKMVPSCDSVSKKPDKLTILRMAVGHLQSIRGTLFLYVF